MFLSVRVQAVANYAARVPQQLPVPNIHTVFRERRRLGGWDEQRSRGASEEQKRGTRILPDNYENCPTTEEICNPSCC